MADIDGIDELFKVADKSKDKKVSLKELDKVFELLGLQLKFKDVKKIIEKYDDNNDKHLNKQEFRALLTDFYQSEKYALLSSKSLFLPAYSATTLSLWQ